MDSAVAFHEVTVRLNRHLVLDRVSAFVPKGAATAIVGPNGAGKTTLLLTLLGFVPYRGTIHFSGGVAPRIGYMPQKLNLDPGLPLTVSEFIALDWQRLPLWFGVRKRHRERVIRLLEAVGAPQIRNRRLCDLSGGELRRVMLALALGRDPELLIMDEPTSGVDFQGETVFHSLMGELRRKMGFTQLMVCHNLAAVKSHADHVVCLNRKTVAEGDPRAILTPRTLTLTFIGQEESICDNKAPASEKKHA